MAKNYNYLRVYNDIKEKILNGEYGHQERLPTEAELETLYGLSRITIKKAMTMLTDEGLVERFPGRGTFVRFADAKVSQERLPAKQPCIGFVMSGFSASFGQGLLQGIADEANRQDCALVVGLRYSSIEDENKLVQRLIDQGADGVIAMAMHSDNEINAGIVNNAMKGYPLVLVDRFLEGISLPYIGSDHADAAFQATQYLFSLGHKCIGLISSAPTTSAITERERGYMKAYAMTKYRLSQDYLFFDIKSSMPGCHVPEVIRRDVECMKRYYQENPNVTAVLCIDFDTMKVCEAAANELGLRIPEDLSLVCFDAPDDGLTYHEYTHIRQAELEIGERAVRMLLDVIRGDREPKYLLVPTELCIGNSTASPSR